MDNINSTTSGIGLFGLLTVALVVLKLLGLVNISWFWIIALPILGPILSFLLIALFVMFFFGLGSVLLRIYKWIYSIVRTFYYNLRKPS